MRILRIHLDAFGSLGHFQAELAPGLNLFHGLNDAGKSTLQQAVLALLYGFYEHRSARPAETARYEGLRPWAGGEYRGLLQYELQDGRRFEVRRDFATADIPTQLIDLATGRDMATDFGSGRHGNIPFARRHLGVSRAVFESCAFISQGEVLSASRGADPREIGDSIASLADSAGRDVSAANAIKRLDELVDKHIGRTDKARTKPLPRTRERLSAAQGELWDLEAARQAVREKAAQLDDLQARLSSLDDEISRTEVLHLRAQNADLSHRLSALHEAGEEVREAQDAQERLKGYASIPYHLRDEALDLRGRRQGAIEALRQAEEDLSAASHQLPEADRLQYQALQAEVGTLSPDQLQTLQRLAYAQPAPVRRLFAALLATIRAVGRALASLVRGLIRLILRRRAAAPAEQPASPPPPAVKPAEAVLLLEKHRRFLTLRPTFDTVARLQAEESRAAADLTAIDGQLQGLLGDAATPALDDIQASIAAFLEACDHRKGYESALAAQEEAARRRRALLQGRSPQELARHREQLRADLETLLSRRPDLAEIESDQPAQELTARVEDLRRRRGEDKVRQAQLRAEIDTALGQHRPRAEIEEEIERWQREVSQLERARAAAKLAKDTIEEAMRAVYRDFAPHVGEFLGHGLDFVSEGRYRKAFVDPSSLKVSLDIPSKGQVLEINPKAPWQPVGHGTLTLVYVLMRIGLAQHMSSIGEPVPLVLDDPFVDIDSQRLPRLLDFLARLSHERGIQILLFSKDDTTLRWFQDKASEPQHHLHHLPSPDEPSGPATAALLDRRLL